MSGAPRPTFRAVLLAAALAAALPAAPASAQIVRAFTPRYSTNDRGDITIVGNTLMSCGSASGCAAAQGGSGGRVNNDAYVMQYVDVDGVPSTFCSSTAPLALPAGATVLWAGLYWGGNSADAARNQVVFSTPAAAGLALTATQLDASGNHYQGFRDVTALVAAAGSASYTVANVRSIAGRDSYAGWSLVVAYRLASLAIRNLVAFDGYAAVTPSTSVTIPVSGFLTPLSGAVDTRLGMVGYEGDLGLPGDQFLLNGAPLSNAANPSDNFLNSSISAFGAPVTGKTPDYVNQLGFDADLLALVNALPNGATGATLGLATSADRFFPGVVTFTTELYAPNLSGDNFRKTVTDLNGAPARPGDVLEYTIDLVNGGDDTAVETVFRDTLPANTSYVPGSIVVLTGANAGGKSDAPGDDQAEYEAAPRRVTVRVGAGADAASGGALASLASTRLRFRVTIDSPSPGPTVANQGALAFTGMQTGFAYASASDGDPAVPGSQPTVIPVTSGVAVTGTFYADADHDGMRDAGEAGTGAALFAKLVSSASPSAAQAVVAVDAATGAYGFASVPAGTYSIVLDDGASPSDVAPTPPARWIVTEAAPGVRASVMVAATDVSGQDVGLFHGSRIEGSVFRDDGTGGGAPNDGARQPGEAGLPAARVR
ncbi:MAG: DUF11 domain-containing protein, partial [Candidatus Eiseniibacteriota bacterium]